MEIIKGNYSDCKIDKIGNYLLGVPVSVFFDEEIPQRAIYMPEMFLIEKVDSLTVKITPKDSLDDLYYIINDIEKYPYTQMIKIMDLLVTTISTIKKFSTTAPVFEFETVKNYFLYSFTLSGETIEDIFEQIFVIYSEIARQYVDDDEDALVLDNFLNKIK